MKPRRLHLEHQLQIFKEDTTMTNKEKALALIGTFVSGDLEKAKSLLAPEYKQHNLAFGTGADAFVAAVAGLQQAPVKTTVNNIRAFEDGDHVFLQTVYNFAGAGEQVAFDVFHFNADGKTRYFHGLRQDAHGSCRR
jgi:predicted SnoaL-like aldol condensation-catalyzing enzyme